MLSADVKSGATEGVALSLRQFSQAWQVMCSAGPGYERQESGDIEYIFSGIPIAFFNVALMTGRSISSDTLRRQASDACTWVADKNVPWLFVVTHDTLEPGVDAAGVLAGCGLAPIMPLTGMVAYQISPATRSASGLQLTVPQENDRLAAILDVNSIAYNMPLDAGKPVVGTPSFWTGHVPVLGLVDGKPASSAAVFLVDGYRYVALVATAPTHQRRGFAEAAMRYALAVAAERHGERPTVLHATEAGRPIYERMGYSKICSHTVFMEKRFLDAH
jgi:GNAT superfamily N-acetyltransferase